MKITKRQLRRIIKEEINRMTGLPEGTPTMTVEVEWYPPPRDEETEGRIYIVPLELAKQGDEAVRDYIDGKFILDTNIYLPKVVAKRLIELCRENLIDENHKTTTKKNYSGTG